MAISIDEAISLIVSALKIVPPLNTRGNHRNYGCDLWVPDIVGGWWGTTHKNTFPFPESTEVDRAPFYDAAWELVRRGVLRQGPAFPYGVSNNTATDGYSLTLMGREWVKKYDQQGPFPIDPGSFSVLIGSYTQRFGQGFIQRASEAAGCYRTLNYLASCAMVGAACEAILLSIALAKTSDEKRVQKTYLGRDGRRNLIRELIVPGLPAFLEQAIETASNLLSYWRDSAAHGYAVKIEEFEAHDAMSRLLRFAQLVDQHWDKFEIDIAA